MNTKTLVLMDAVLELIAGIPIDTFIEWKEEHGVGNLELHGFLDDFYEAIAPTMPFNSEPYDVSDAIVSAFRNTYDDFPTND